MLARQIAHQGQRGTIGMGRSHFFGHGQSLFSQGFGRLRHGIEQFLSGQHGEHLALDGFAADDHVEGWLDTDHAGQTLSAACARDQAQFDFGQGNGCAGCSNAVVATERQLKTPAHHHRMHGGNHGLGRIFASADHAEQIGLLQGFGRAKFADVRATGKSFACTSNDDGLDGGVVVGFFQVVGDAHASGQPQTVDGRVHQCDNRDITVDFVFSCHAGVP